MPKHFLKTTKNMERKGYCRRCGRIRDKTDFHHLEYRPWAPWEMVIEVCFNCHVDLDPALEKRLTEKQIEKYRKNWKKVDSILFCYVCGQNLELQGEIPTRLKDSRVVSFCVICSKSVLNNRTPYQ